MLMKDARAEDLDIRPWPFHFCDLEQYFLLAIYHRLHPMIGNPAGRN